MQAVPETVFSEVKDALQRATTMAMQGQTDDMSAQNPPLLVVKNTFLEVRDPLAISEKPKSLSCPLAAFVGGCGDQYGDVEPFPQTLTGSSDIDLSELSAAARVFSTGEISREAMEAAGHVVTRRPSSPPLQAGPAQEPIYNARLLPPPLLCEPEEIPEAPQWSPKVPFVGGLMHTRPVPPPLHTPVSSAPTAPPLQPPLLAPPAPAVPTPPRTLPMAHHLVDSKGAPVFSAPMRSEALFRVAYMGGVALRQGPYFDGVRTGAMLMYNEIFCVSEEIQGSDGRLYLRLADGRGWAFDDSALMPHDPSVVRGSWAPLSTTSTPSTFASTPASSVWEPMEEPMTLLGEVVEEEKETKKKRRRRKRGGVKRRPKNKIVEADPDPEAEADTDAPPSEIEIVGSEGPHSEADGSSADARSEVEVRSLVSSH